MHYSPELAREIAARHGLVGDVALLPKTGMVNEVWSIGESHILRITHQEDCDDEAEREAAIVPFVVDRGIRTPALLASNSACDMAPRPYTIYERAPGVLLGVCDQDPAFFEPAYREIGRQCALLHSLEVPGDLGSHLRSNEAPDPRTSLAKAWEAGLVDDCVRAGLEELIGRLEVLSVDRRELALIHWDIHPWNVLVDEASGELAAIIDWGDAGLADPAYDLASMPVSTLEGMLAGYCETRSVDRGFMAACLLEGIALAFWETRYLTEEDGKRAWWRIPIGGPEELLAQANELLDGLA
jgi:Ser/Thr protein kinase RdoA (MazF antagonist)